MDNQLLRYYERELQYIREMGAQFAEQFPKIASRLDLDGFDCADPYVERLLEGFAFLTARVHLQIDSEVPEFTQHLLETVYPHYLCPTPSMVVAQLQPDLTEGSLAEGYEVPRGACLRGRLAEGEQTACEFRTAHPVTLWPLEVAEIDYFSRDAASVTLADRLRDSKAGLRIRLRATAGMDFCELALDRLPIFLAGREEQPMRLYEQLVANLTAIVVQPASDKPAWQEVLNADACKPLGFEPEHSLLPTGPRSFDGYRLLAEYFAFFQRFLFVEFTGLKTAVRRCDTPELDIICLFDRTSRELENLVVADDVLLHCTPAINLFERRADTIHLNRRDYEFHVVPDRTRPLDLEVYQIKDVIGFGSEMDKRQRFLPFYSTLDPSELDETTAYYTVRRTPRVASSSRIRTGPRSSYAGGESYLSLVDGRQAPYDHHLQTLMVETLCTNRDLPLQLSVGSPQGEFTLDIGAPVSVIRCVAGPTPPRPSLAERGGELLWRLVSHLSLNYLSLVDNDSSRGASSLRDLLRVYTDSTEPIVQKQIDGVRSVESRSIIRQIPTRGPITFGRGVEITLTLEESAFKGCGVFILGSVLEHFFCKYVSINSFTETILRTRERGEIQRWPMRTGRRPTI